MKAILYAVCGESGWQTFVSVAWDVDRRYWMDAAFRAGAADGWTGGLPEGLRAGHPCRLVRVRKPLPLGMAEMACVMCMEKADAGKVGDVRNELREAEMACAGWMEKANAGKVGDVETRLREKVRRAAVMAGEKDTSIWEGVEIENIAEGGDGGDAAYEEGRSLGELARKLSARLYGRSLLEGEVAVLLTDSLPGGKAAAIAPALQLAALLGGVRLLAGVTPVSPGRRAAVRFRCRRCGSGEAQLRRTPCASCGRLCAYCEACLTMGRSRECALLVAGGSSAGIRKDLGNAATPADLAASWGLSPAQSIAASAALTFLLEPELQERRGLRRWWGDRLRRIGLRPSAGARIFLIWAVTGAGKTEMIFPLLEAVLARGGKAAVATPRRDVVLELAPRLARAFPDAHLAVLYGGSPDRFELGDLTLATTHQLIRFRGAFDLVVIDEVDAFPYHNDPMLHFAASQSRAASGTTILLSATPPTELQRQAARRRLPHARVAVRHHGHPLPVPRRLSVPPASRWIGKKRIPPPLLKAIRSSADRGAQLFLFIASIRQVDPLVRCLRDQAANIGLSPDAIDGTSSQDRERAAKVTAFRETALRLLVTTTILERGITIPKSDVFVLDADKPLFDASSLVQMAGRAGRSAADPDGRVYFAAGHWTNSQRQACRQIREMNAYAGKNGYLRKRGDHP